MSRRRNLIVGWMSAIVVIALFARLGWWQYGRMHEKQAMLDAAASVLTGRKPLPLAQAAWDSSRARALDWVEGSGKFADYTRPILLDNQIRNGRAGVRVYHVYDMEVSSREWRGAGAVLVDLGWLPLGADRSLPEIHAPTRDRVAVRGLLAPPPSGGLALGAGIERRNEVWLATRIDLAALAPKVLGWVPAWTPKLAPRVLRLDPAQPIGYARDLDILPNTLPPQKHLGYAVQWFALALTVLATALILTFRKSKP